MGLLCNYFLVKSFYRQESTVARRDVELRRSNLSAFRDPKRRRRKPKKKKKKRRQRKEDLSESEVKMLVD